MSSGSAVMVYTLRLVALTRYMDSDKMLGLSRCRNPRTIAQARGAVPSPRPKHHNKQKARLTAISARRAFNTCNILDRILVPPVLTKQAGYQHTPRADMRVMITPDVCRACLHEVLRVAWRCKVPPVKIQMIPGFMIW